MFGAVNGGSTSDARFFKEPVSLGPLPTQNILALVAGAGWGESGGQT